MSKWMRLSVIVLVTVTALTLFVTACRPEGLTPTPKAGSAGVAAAATATPAPPTATLAELQVEAEPEPEEETKAAPKEGISEELLTPELVDVISGTVASLVELYWDWDKALGEDDWFELQIWPYGQEEPSVYGWQKESTIRLTSAHLLPGRYWWRVVVVRGRGDDRAEELCEYSEAWIFTIVRPSTLAKMSITPPIVPSRTPSPTPTVRRWWYTWPTYTPTPAQPTPTFTTAPTVVQPTATFTAQPTVAPPTPTRTPEQYPVIPTNTPVVPTNTPVPPTNTPVEPTSYPPIVQPTAGPTADVYP